MTDAVVIPAGMEQGVKTYRTVPGRVADGFLYISGQIGAFADDGSVVADPAEQGRIALNNLGGVLEAAGCSFADVVEITTYHVGGTQKAFDWFLPAKEHLFPEPFPAWTAVGVTDLAHGAIIEIAAVARVRG